MKLLIKGLVKQGNVTRRKSSEGIEFGRNVNVAYGPTLAVHPLSLVARACSGQAPCWFLTDLKTTVEAMRSFG